MTRRPGRCFLAAALAAAVLLPAAALRAQDLLEKLAGKQSYRSKRVSSFDRSGGNRDALRIEPGKTAVLAELNGPAAIHHIWVTVAAEAFYGRKLVLRVYWDGEDTPSVEAPLGDFFGVGHGLNRDLSSLPVAVSSEGRARNCYWYMPFRWSCLVTVTNEGSRAVDAFYYYIDYRELEDLSPEAPYFHAQYNQAFPVTDARNYVILDARGSGHYVGCVFSVLQRTMGWWGEGDDMIYVDGEEAPSLHGTGSEDYFSDAWGMRQSSNLFYGCPLQEEDFQVGSKASVYRFHVPDPVAFKKSLRVTIEHGHANDRSDYLSSVAFWYQTEPHAPFPKFPAADRRLPFAMEAPEGFVFPDWRLAEESADGVVYRDRAAECSFRGLRLNHSLLPYYGADARRYPVLSSEGAAEGTRLTLDFPAEARDLYSVNLYLLKSPNSGNFHILRERHAPAPDEAAAGGERTYEVLGTFEGYDKESHIAVVSLKDVLLASGPNQLVFQAAGKDARASGLELKFVGYALAPSARRFVKAWNLIGPFPAADMKDLYTAYPPESDTDLKKKFKGANEAEVGWRSVKADDDGFLRLDRLVTPNEQAVVYCLAYVQSPEDGTARCLLGSDDGVRVWVNDELVHTNPAYRGAYPDQDGFEVRLKKGWNKVLVKVLQGAGGWGLYFRLADPDGVYRWSLNRQ
jgi:hypothetical protein